MKQLPLLLLFLSGVAFSQDSITLKTVFFETENLSFYIKEITDTRKEKNLGLHKNEQGEKTILKLSPNAVESVTSFIEASIPKVESKKAISIKINKLNIQETRINQNEVIARAEIDLAFYEKEKGRWQEIYRIQRNEDQVFPALIIAFSTAEDVFATHEQRIRAALEYCLLAFIESQNDDRTYTNSVQHFETSNNNEEEKLRNWYNIITYRQIITSTYHEGWAIGYTGFLDSDEKFIIPYEINFEQYRVKDNFASREGFEYVDSYTLRPGLFGYKKIIPGVYGAVGINVPIGVEILKEIDAEDESYKFLIGIGASQGIKIIPWESYGLVFGAEFFQQIQNSEIYERDIGFEVSIGFNF